MLKEKKKESLFFDFDYAVIKIYLNLICVLILNKK